jgi:hypothetical protein
MRSYCRILLVVTILAGGAERILAQEPGPGPSGDQPAVTPVEPPPLPRPEGEAAAAPTLPAVRSTMPRGPEPEITPDVTPKPSPTGGGETKTPAPTKTGDPTPMLQTAGSNSSGGDSPGTGGDSPGTAPNTALDSLPPAADNDAPPAASSPAERSRTSQTLEILAWAPAALGTLAVVVIVYLVASRPKNEHLSIFDRAAHESGPPFTATRRS